MKRSHDQRQDAEKKRSKETEASPFDYAPKAPHNPVIHSPTMPNLPAFELPGGRSDQSRRNQRSSHVKAGN